MAAIRQRWFGPDELQRALNRINWSLHFEEELVGISFLGRPIQAYKLGKGPVRLLLWSQMHGNEPTATHAILDFMELCVQGYSPKRLEQWKEKLSIYFIPMLNPDGAALFSRQNAQGIDLNRDALNTKSPEMKAFFTFVNKVKPDWAFNLHDQRNIFHLKESRRSATLSFLSPSASPSAELTPAREAAMDLIGRMTQQLQAAFAGHLARFNDAYYPLALGEYFSRHHVPCILIESGASPDDYPRIKARSGNLMALECAFDFLARSSQETKETSAYFNLPMNANGQRDILFRQAKVVGLKEVFETDLALLLKEVPHVQSGALELYYEISEVGDLHLLHGLIEYHQVELRLFDAEALQIGDRLQAEWSSGGKRYRLHAGRLEEHLL